MVTLLQIGGLINLEERSGSFLPELPYTNRGVIRQKEELSALIDWCQITVKEVPLEAVIEDVLRIPLELMTVTGYEKGIAVLKPAPEEETVSPEDTVQDTGDKKNGR